MWQMMAGMTSRISQRVSETAQTGIEVTASSGADLEYHCHGVLFPAQATSTGSTTPPYQRREQTAALAFVYQLAIQRLMTSNRRKWKVRAARRKAFVACSNVSPLSVVTAGSTAQFNQRTRVRRGARRVAAK